MSAGREHRKARPSWRAFSVPGLLVGIALLAVLAACTARPGRATRNRPGVDAVALPYASAGAPALARGVALRAAFDLEGRHPGFGGISGLMLDGTDLLMLSDRGMLFRARCGRSADGRLASLTLWRHRLVGNTGHSPDTEAITRGPDGALYIGVEGWRRLGRLDGEALLPGPTLPEPLASAPRNGGIESLTTLPDGTLLAIGEETRAADDLFEATMLSLDGSHRRVRVRVKDGFLPTDAAVVGSWLLVLERRLSLLGGLSGRLVAIHLDRTPIPTDAVLDGSTLAELGGRDWSENWEGLTGRADADGLDLYLVADDNFSRLQRTLLVELRWRPQAP